MDTFSRIGAARLATKIQVYWVSMGLSDVRAWTEPFTSIEEGAKITLYSVKSNISDMIKRTGS